MHQPVVALRDIADVHGFVAGTIQRFERQSRFTLDQAEREELHLEGVCILYELERRFEPHRDGYANAGKFSGYAAWKLPKKLGDVWHQWHPEHCRVTAPDGSRRWAYLKGAVSLDDQVRLTADGAGEPDERRFLDPRFWTSVPAAA